MNTPDGGAEAVLLDAAFGAHPGTHPLPAPTTTESRWWRAVALGGQGRYAAAHSELVTILGDPTGAAWTSLAASTRGSHLRQLGRHDAARPWDARGLGTAADAPAQIDALLGLAADALGHGQTVVARRLLARCAPNLHAAGWRGTLRWWWVSAETALCADAQHEARGHAEQGERLAQQCGSVRHQMKSRLVLAAARGGNNGAALASEVLERAQEHGVLSLQWAAAMLINAVQPGSEIIGAQLRATTELLHRRSAEQWLR